MYAAHRYFACHSRLGENVVLCIGIVVTVCLPPVALMWWMRNTFKIVCEWECVIDVICHGNSGILHFCTRDSWCVCVCTPGLCAWSNLSVYSIYSVCVCVSASICMAMHQQQTLRYSSRLKINTNIQLLFACCSCTCTSIRVYAKKKDEKKTETRSDRDTGIAKWWNVKP